MRRMGSDDDSVTTADPVCVHPTFTTPLPPAAAPTSRGQAAAAPSARLRASKGAVCGTERARSARSAPVRRDSAHIARDTVAHLQRLFCRQRTTPSLRTGCLRRRLCRAGTTRGAQWTYVRSCQLARRGPCRTRQPPCRWWRTAAICSSRRSHCHARTATAALAEPG